MALQAFANYVTRGSLAPMIQYIVADLAMNDAQKAVLLGAFFPIFTPFQVVAGPLTQLFGGKRLLTLNLGGMAALLMLLPTCSRARGTGAMSACLAAIGVCQAVLVPAQGQLKRNWLTDGPERVWALRVMGLGNRVGYTAAAALVPWLAERRGWRAVPYTLGGLIGVFGVAWQALATEHPAPDPAPDAPATEDKEPPEQGEEKPAAVAAKQKTMEWGIFRVPAVLGALLAHFASNNLGYLFILWTPTFYKDVLRTSQVMAGAYISFPMTVSIWLPFLVGALENRMRSGGMPLLQIRKKMNLAGSVVQAVCTLLFAVSPTALLACAANCGVQVGSSLQGSGYSANYYEVGGPDTALLYAVGNALASIPGLVLPPLGLLIFTRTGSYFPLFGLCAAITVSTGLLFQRVASLSSGRELLAERGRAGRKAA